MDDTGEARVSLALLAARGGFVTAFVIFLIGATPTGHAQAAPSIVIALSPGDHLPNTVPLTAEVTLSNLDPTSYSELTFRADLTGHESRTSHCYGEDTGTDIVVPVAQSEESLTVRLFTRCVNVRGGFGTYDYRLDISLSGADPMQPGETIGLASMQLHFLVSTYLTPGEVFGPPPAPAAQAWMEPDPRVPAMRVGEWRRFRFRSSVPRYPEDHLNVNLNSSQTGSFHGIGGFDTPPGDPDEACSGEGAFQNWRRAIHQTLWVVACEPGPAVFLLQHETQGVAPLYTYDFVVLPARDTVSPPPIPVTAIAPPSRGPVATEDDFGWNIERDIDPLAEANDAATGLWGNGATIWVAQNSDGAGDSVFAYDLASGEPAGERDFELDKTNLAPRGLWSNGETIWVSDSGRERLFAHDLESGERLPARDINLSDANEDPRGIWSDRTTIWVLDASDASLYLYDLGSGEQTAVYELDSANDDPHGIWSDGVGMWVSDGVARKLLAYRLEAGALVREGDEDFTKLTRARNSSPRGIWSDGDVMYVVDADDDKIYSYNMPDAADARLASLTLTHVDLGEFSPERRVYTGILSEGARETVIDASAVQSRAKVEIVPTDVDGDLENGHQAAVDEGAEVTVTVTSEDGSRRRVYRVLIEEPAPPAPPVPPAPPAPGDDCLRGLVDARFSLVTYEGGSVADLEVCARHVGVRSVYALVDEEFVSLILDAPAFVNGPFVDQFGAGIPAGTPLIVLRVPPPDGDPVAAGGAAGE